ncbi:AraC family transcriptional regulator [Megalodesulfovibrio paquesii]
MSTIAAALARLAVQDGITPAALPGVHVFRSSRSSARAPLLYKQGIIILGQGAKHIYLAGERYTYDPDHYLVLSVPLPLECEACIAPGEPLLGMTIDLDMALLHGITSHMDPPSEPGCTKAGCRRPGLFVGHVDAVFQDALLRLLHALDHPVESRVLGPGLLRELMYRILCGRDAACLHALVLKHTGLARIEKALRQIHDNFHQSFNVEQLAGEVNMSASAFHRAFKQVTSLSPIQYVKQVRLNMAKNLLVDQGFRASDAARQVGYESVSQFNREFKRYFGASPRALAHGERG